MFPWRQVSNGNWNLIGRVRNGKVVYFHFLCVVCLASLQRISSLFCPPSPSEPKSTTFPNANHRYLSISVSITGGEWREGVGEKAPPPSSCLLLLPPTSSLLFPLSNLPFPPLSSCSHLLPLSSFFSVTCPLLLSPPALPFPPSPPVIVTLIAKYLCLAFGNLASLGYEERRLIT